MFKKKCRCGSIEKSFKVDIGPFFMAECCEEAGYNVKGELVSESTEEESFPDQDLPEIVQTESEVVVESVDYSKMNQKELQAECDKREIQYAGNDSKAKLREKLK